MRVYQKRSNIPCFLQVSFDRANVNLKFLDIIQQKQKDAEMKDLISVSACGLHYVHHGFQHGENTSQWNLKRLSVLCSKYSSRWISLKFIESPLRRVNDDKITGAETYGYPLQFCAHHWVENEVIAKRTQKALLKVVEVNEYWQSLTKWKKPGQGKHENNKSFQVLLSCSNDDLVLQKFVFFEKITHKQNIFLRRFRTDAPIVPFLADTIQEIFRELRNLFILNSIMNGAMKTWYFNQNWFVRCN